MVLLSLDGAGAAELRGLWEAGSLSGGGFERFFREGVVAEGLVPVNPTLTAVNHISLATGFEAGATGIVSNTFRLPGAPWLATASGFAAPIGTETLWEAARRQGRRVGTTTWPGADGRGERRSAGWGLVYVNDPLRRAELVTLSRSDWRVPETVPGRVGDASRGQVLAARVDLPGREGPVGAQTFDLFAVDCRDEGQEGYDSVVVAERGSDGTSEPISVGSWGEVPVRLPAGGGAPARLSRVRVKVLALAPDLAGARIYVGPLFRLEAYPEAFAAEAAAAGLVWPGPPDDRGLSDSWAGKQGIDLATWVEQAEAFAAFFGASLRAAAARPDWDLLLGYVPVIDEAGHQLLLEEPRQRFFTPELAAAAAAARRRVWQAVDRELAGLLAGLDLRTTTVAVVSDHGMAPVHTALDPNVLLQEWGLLAVADGRPRAEGTRVYAVSSGAVAHVYFAPEVPEGSERERLAGELRELFSGWRAGGERAVRQVFTRREAAAVGLDHPNSGDLVLFAAPGFTFHGGGLAQGRAVLPSTALGMHGYVNDDPRMRGIFLALGAGVGAGRPGLVRSTEVVVRVAGWLGIEPPRRVP